MGDATRVSPISPPGSYHSPSRLLSNHKTLCVKNHTFAVYTLFPLMLVSSGCKPGAPSSPLREMAHRLFYSKNGAVVGPLDCSQAYAPARWKRFYLLLGKKVTKYFVELLRIPMGMRSVYRPTTVTPRLVFAVQRC